MPILLTAYEVDSVPPSGVIFGQSDAMMVVRDAVDKVAVTNLPVLISGESETGKEVIAKVIHRVSPWRNTPFVKISCPTLKAASELCGFGGSTETQETCPERADLTQGGTLFFDEVGELSPPLQGQLLNLLEDNLLSSGNKDEGETAKVRIICSTTHLNLEAEAKAGGFRQDLYYRISVVRIEVPALRQRSTDIPLILKYFLETYSKLYGRSVAAVPKNLVEMLQSYAWPGNILQLENFIKRYVILGPGNPVGADMLNGSAWPNVLSSAVGLPTTPKP